MATHREPSTSKGSIFQLEPYSADLCVGKFVIDREALRRAFRELGAGGHIYGCRRLNPDGTSDNVGLMDTCRQTFERQCAKYGAGDGGLADFKTALEANAGLTLNSLQNPHAKKQWIFNELANAFLTNLHFPPHGFAEELEMVLFLGTYDRGFGLHKDTNDTAMFVLDGTKCFVVEVEGRHREFSLEAGQYLRWSSQYAHSNWNPKGYWSMSLHIALGPSIKQLLEDGMPVEYIYSTTKLKSFTGSL